MSEPTAAVMFIMCGGVEKHTSLWAHLVSATGSAGDVVAVVGVQWWVCTVWMCTCVARVVQAYGRLGSRYQTDEEQEDKGVICRLEWYRSGQWIRLRQSTWKPRRLNVRLSRKQHTCSYQDTVVLWIGLDVGLPIFGGTDLYELAPWLTVLV